jgi:hypothetical protein
MRPSLVSSADFGLSLLVPLMAGRQHLGLPALVVVCCVPVCSYAAHAHWTYRTEN